jgi:hypothetical protein
MRACWRKPRASEHAASEPHPTQPSYGPPRLVVMDFKVVRVVKRPVDAHLLIASSRVQLDAADAHAVLQSCDGQRGDHWA